jgi:hypothetical protein
MDAQQKIVGGRPQETAAGGKGLKNALSMANYCQHLAPGLTLLKQFFTQGCLTWVQNCGFHEGPYV